MEINLLESAIKVREGKRWKSRWCVLKKISPVADCLHLHVYKESSGSKKQKEKASYLLEKYCGIESGYRVDKEQNVLAVLCVKEAILLAFDHRHKLQEWTVFIRDNLGHETTFHATLIQSPSEAKLQQRPVRIFVTNKRLSLVAHIPPVVLLSWLLADIKRFGTLDSDRFCLEGGSRAGKGTGLFALLTDHGKDLEKLLHRCSHQATLQPLNRRKTHTGCISNSISPIELAQSRRSVLLTTPSPSPLAPQSPVFTFPSPSAAATSITQNGGVRQPQVLTSTPERKRVDRQPTEETTSIFSSFGDLGVNSEVKRCLNRVNTQHDRRSRLFSFGDTISHCGSADLLDRRCSQSSLDYVNSSFATEDHQSLDRSLNRGLFHVSPKKVTPNGLPIVHGHSRSVGCDGSENYMDLSDILKTKAKNSSRKRQTSASSSTCASQNKLDRASLGSNAAIQSNSNLFESHPYANDVFINQVVSQGSQDLLSEILNECQLSNPPLGDSGHGTYTEGCSSRNDRASTNQESHIQLSQNVSSHSSQSQRNRVGPPLITPLKRSMKKEHSYVNYQPNQKTEISQPVAFDQTSFPLLHNLLKGASFPKAETKSHCALANDDCFKNDRRELILQEQSVRTVDINTETPMNGHSRDVSKKLQEETVRTDIATDNYHSVAKFLVSGTEKLTLQQSAQSRLTDKNKKKNQPTYHFTKQCSISLPNLNTLDPSGGALSSQTQCNEQGDSLNMNPQDDSGNGKGSHSQKMKKSHSQQKKRQSRSLPEFDPLRPLEFVDLSKFDGKDEGYLYWMKASPETQSNQKNRGYDNMAGDIEKSTEASYVNVNMKTLKTLGKAPPLGYDNVPRQYSEQSRNYDNVLGDNRTDSAKATVEYENFSTMKSQTVASSNYYQNIPSKCVAVPTGANTYSSSNTKNPSCDVRNKDFYANVAPEIPPKSTGVVKKKKKGSQLPFGGTFAIHGSLRRTKPTQNKRTDLQVNSQAGDIAGSYVKLKGSDEGTTTGSSPNHMGVTNLAHAVTNFEGVGESRHVNDENVELVILDMSEDDPQRDNIANMLVEQGRSLPRGRAVYGRTGPPQPLPPRRFSIHTVSSAATSTQNSTNLAHCPTRSQLDTSAKSAFQPVMEKKSSMLSKTRSASPIILLGGTEQTGSDTYGACKDGREKMPQKRGRDSEYIDMSQPLRPLADEQQQQILSHTVPQLSRSRNNSTSSTVSQSSSQGSHQRDSPYMDMSFMKHKHQSKSPLATPERKKLVSPKSSPLLHADRLCLGGNNRENGCSVIHRRLQHSKSLDNDLEDVYYNSNSNGLSVKDANEVDGNHSQYLPMSTINRHVHTERNHLDDKSSSNKGGDGKLIKRSHSENDGQKPLKPFDGLLDLPCYTEEKHSPSLKKPVDSGYSKIGHLDDDNVSTTSSGSGSGTMSRRGSKGFLARLMRKNSSAKDLAKISKSQEDILEVVSESDKSPSYEPMPDVQTQPVVQPAVQPARVSVEHIYAQIPEQRAEFSVGSNLNMDEPIRDPVTLPLRKKIYRENADTLMLDTVVRKEMTTAMLSHTATGRVCLEHGNLTDEQKQSCASLLSGRSMTPPTPPPNIPLPPPPRKMKDALLSAAAASTGPPLPSKTYKKNRKIPPPLLHHSKPEPEYVDIDDDDFQRGTGRETISSGNVGSSLRPWTEDRSRSGDNSFSHLGFLEDGRPVPPPRPISTLSPSSKSLFYEAEDFCDTTASKPRQIVQRSVSLRTNPVSESTKSPFHGSGCGSVPSHHTDSPLLNSSNDPTTTRYVVGPSASLLRPRSAREYHTVDRKRLLAGVAAPSGGDDWCSSGPSSGSQTPASSSQSSPTKSPGSSLQPNVFNFDLQNVKKMQRNGYAAGGSDTDSPRSPGGNKSGLFRDPDHVYMNLSFPKSPGRSGSPVVIETQHRGAGGGASLVNAPDYANVVLNYAEIDLSHCGKDGASSRRKSDKVTAAREKSNIEYAMIDMVATAAVSRAGKEHIRHREEESLLRHRRQLRRNENNGGGENTSKENSQKKGGKERKSGPATGGGATGSSSTKEKKILGRSNSSISRSSGNSVDRKSSLPA